MRYPSFIVFSSLAGARLVVADLADYVLTDTGTTSNGNDFPGVSVPFGMVKLGPDLHTGSDSYSGYQASGAVMGFSMTHETGTGGAPKYGVVAQMPRFDAADVNWSGKGYEGRAEPDHTEVGYYRTILESGIVAELTATDKAGMFRYTFPEEGGGVPGVIVDVSHVLPSFRGNGWGQSYIGGEITSTAEDGVLRYTGYGDYDNGWNIAPTWRIYFCGHFDSPGEHAPISEGSSVGPFSASSTETLGYTNSDQACRNVDDQIPKDTSFDTIRTATREQWNSQVLSRVTTTDTDTTNLQLLYTSVYFMLLLPTNKTGENPGWGGGGEPYYDDIFTFWDTFRCTTPLFHILQPDAYEDFIRSLLDIFKHDGYVPDARSSFWNGAVQGGSNGDNVLADAYVKGVRGNVDWDLGLEALLQDAEVAPEGNGDPRDRGSDSTKEGRGALPDWKELGFVTKKYVRSVSRAVEYSVNDFSVYQVAKGLGLDTAETYLNRSRNWRNHWNPNLTAYNSTGFLGPRSAGGNHAFVEQDPLSCGGCYWADDYYQATPWLYTFNAHHDIATLIRLSGGAEAFESRLNTTFEKGLFDPTNEPSFTTPYLYHFIGRPDLSVLRVRDVAKTRFSATPGGLPGNSDAGAMQSWLLWAMIGLYPMTGQTTFLLGSPWFGNLEFDLGQGRGGKKVVISSTGGSETSFHVQSVKLNGQDWKKSWIEWSDLFAEGGTLEFELGEQAREWATGEVPPSPATESDEGVRSQVDESIGRSGQADGAGVGGRDVDDGRWTKGAIAGGAVGGVLGLGLVAWGAWALRRKRRGEKEGEDGGEDGEAGEMKRKVLEDDSTTGSRRSTMCIT